MTFDEFYRGYLEHHRHPLNRALHVLAKVLAVASLALAGWQRSVLPLLAAPPLAVLPCWLGHLLFEGNRPVSWERPTASLLGTLASPLRSRRARRSRRAAGCAPGADPSPAPAGRPYYSFLADLRMCAGLLTPRRAASARSAGPGPRAASEET